MKQEVYCPKCDSTKIRIETKRHEHTGRVSMDELPSQHRDDNRFAFRPFLNYTEYKAICQDCGYTKSWSDLLERFRPRILAANRHTTP